METSTMTPTPGTAKSRTVALPHKSTLTGSKGAAKSHDVAALVDAMWNGTAFGPYLVTLSRRAE
jgi:hypothetical protein